MEIIKVHSEDTENFSLDGNCSASGKRSELLKEGQAGAGNWEEPS